MQPDIPNKLHPLKRVMTNDFGVTKSGFQTGLMVRKLQRGIGAREREEVKAFKCIIRS